MAKPVFSQLCHELPGLQKSKHLGLAEKIAIFPQIYVEWEVQTEIRERFKHAPGTILIFVGANLLDRNTECEIGFFMG